MITRWTLSALAVYGLLSSCPAAAQVRARSPEAGVTVRTRGEPNDSRQRSRRRSGARMEGTVNVEVAVRRPRVVVVEQASLGTASPPHHEVPEAPPPRPPPREETGSGGLQISSFHLGYAGAWDHVGVDQHGFKLSLAAHLAEDTWFLEFATTPVRWGDDPSGRRTNLPAGTLGIRLGVTLAPQLGRFYAVLATGGGAMTYPDQDRGEVGVWVSQLGFGIEFGAPGFTDEDGIGGFVDVRAEAWVFGGGLEPRLGLAWTTGFAIAIY
ncbi:MAG: hypothetical protein AB8I08_17405 [Sandaracinaceae bacterium]